MRYLLFILLLIPNKFVYCQDSISPHFKGGDSTLLRFLTRNVNYPEEALELNIQGTVYMSFFVEVNGSISNVKVLKEINGGCTEEARRVVYLTQGMWEPAMINGKPERAEIRLPVRFTIQELIESESADDFYKIAMDLMKVGNYGKAIPFFPCYSSDETIKVDAFYSRGLCKFMLKEYLDAISDWEEAMKLDCKNCKAKVFEAYKCLGDELVEKGKYKIALTWYTKYLDNIPQDTDVLLKRGRTYFKLKDKEKACVDWQMAKELGSTKVQVLINEYCDE